METQNLPPGLHAWVSRVLLAGVLLSVGVLIIGVVRLFLVGGTLSTGPIALQWGSLPGRISTGDPYAILGLGTLILVLTPFCRVLISVVLYARQRDRAFTAITLFVLLSLVGSMLAGVTL